jgi:tetratricopeptide (TPR) repeat protein
VLELRPGDQLGLYGAGLVYEVQGKYPEAISAFGPPYQQSGFDIAVAYAAAGDRRNAIIAQTNEMRRLQQENLYVRPGYLAELYTALGNKDEAMRWLERGYREHDAWLALLKVWPRFDALRSDPRFQELVRRMNFPAGD